MQRGAHLQSGAVRLASRRYRRILTASLATLLTSATLLGLIGLIRWRGRQALQSDTRSVLAQSAQQLLRALQSRRGTLTFLRDTLTRRADMTLPQLQAMGGSAVEHTRHLLGAGTVHALQPPVWWAQPSGLSPADRARLNRALVERMQVRGIWRVPSTMVTTVSGARPLLIMLEPLRGAAGERSAVVGVFDVKPLLADFFLSTVAPHQPVQVMDGTTLLYRSSTWPPAVGEERPILATHPIALDAARWTIQMQPGSTRVVQTLSWLNVLLIVLSVLAGLGVTIIVWLLAARTWLLQRAVERRTAALRRASQRLRQLAITDELTGLHNRRFFLERWERECERAKRYRRPLVCLMIDVNGFKQVNDRLGHLAGDLVLKQVAQELKTMLRQSDLLARLGGDEFVIALPETTPEQAASVAEKLRQVSIELPEGRAGGLAPVSLSVGMSEIEEDRSSAEDVLHAADQSLYASKQHRHAVPHPHR